MQDRSDIKLFPSYTFPLFSIYVFEFQKKKLNEIFIKEFVGKAMFLNESI